MLTLNCNGRLVSLDRPLVMGIINITPDSFYPASRVMNEKEILIRAEKMINEKANIIDIGGQSTRPGAQKLEVAEELARVIPAVKSLRKAFPDLIISVDSFSSVVAGESIAAGASIINDISGGEFDHDIVSVAATAKVPFICTHIKGTPENMQHKPAYENVTREVLDFFIAKINVAKMAGVSDLIIDPGFGFGKDRRHNFQLLKDLPVFKILERPIMVGISRKSTIYKTLGITSDEALNGSTVLHTIALLKGAHIIRVHDVKEAVEAVTLVEAYERG
jgi:dihydropteroate synthase